MTRPFFPTGLGIDTQFNLEAELQQVLLEEIEAHGEQLKDIDRFLQEIDHSLTRYKSFESIKNDSKPAVVRKKLRDAIKIANKLKDSLNKFDGNTYDLVNENVDGGMIKYSESIEIILKGLNGALLDAKEFPNNFPDHPKLLLAEDIRVALKFNGIMPKSTKGGVYENVLRIILEIATKKEIKDVHKLVLRTISTAP